MSKVIVTGGAGFIGSHIVEQLVSEGYQVAIIDNLSSGKIENIIPESVRFYETDINDLNQLMRVFSLFQPNFVIHQAAQVSVANSIQNFIEDETININGTLKVIEASRLYAVSKIVFASSAAVYGFPSYFPIDVSHPINPISPYGLSKYTSEKYLQLTNSLYGVDYSILRYSNVYGPRQNISSEGGVIGLFINKLLADEQPFLHGDGNQTRDFIYVEDVAKANVKALTSGTKGTYNISSNSEIAINNLLDIILELTDKSITPIYMPMRLGDLNKSTLCNKLTIEALNWKPRINLKSGLIKTIEYYKNLFLNNM